MIFKTKVLIQFRQKQGGGRDNYPPGFYGPARALSLVQSCSRVSFQIPVHWMHNSPIFDVLRRTILNLFLIIILSCTSHAPIIMPHPISGCHFKAEYQGFLLRYRLFQYKHWFLPNFEHKYFPDSSFTPCINLLKYCENYV